VNKVPVPDWFANADRLDSDFIPAFQQVISKSGASIHGWPSLPSTQYSFLPKHWFACSWMVHSVLEQGICLDQRQPESENLLANSLRLWMASPDRFFSNFWVDLFNNQQWPPFLIVSWLLDGMPVCGDDWIADKHEVFSFSNSFERHCQARIFLAQILVKWKNMSALSFIQEHLLPAAIVAVKVANFNDADTLLDDYAILPCVGNFKPFSVSEAIIATLGSKRFCLRKGILKVPEFKRAGFSINWDDFAPHASMCSLLEILNRELNTAHCASPSSDITERQADTSHAIDEYHLSSVSDSISARAIFRLTSISEFEKSVEDILGSSDQLFFDLFRHLWNQSFIVLRRPDWGVEEAEVLGSLIDLCLEQFDVLKPEPSQSALNLVKILEQYSQSKGLILVPANMMDHRNGPPDDSAMIQASFMNGVDFGTHRLVRCGWSIPTKQIKPLYCLSVGHKSDGFAEFEKSVSSLPPDHELRKAAVSWAQATLDESLAQTVVSPIVQHLFFADSSHLMESSLYLSLQNAARIALSAQSGISFRFMSTDEQPYFDSDTCVSIHGGGTKANKIKRFLSPMILAQDSTILLKAKVELL
jgi:hypothetical protein